MFGQANWFIGNQPDNVRAVERYIDESVRLLGVLDRSLAGRQYVAGDYSIADIAIYAWCAGRIQNYGPASWRNSAMLPVGRRPAQSGQR